MQIEEVLKQSLFHLAGLQGGREAFQGAIGQEVEAWYRASREDCDDGVHEENWFLTPSHIVVSKTSGNRLEFRSLSRSRIHGVTKDYTVVQGFGSVKLRPESVRILFQDGEEMDVPRPKHELDNVAWRMYRSFVENLR